MPPNWYKIALKENEFYEFYSYILLSPEILEANPVIFYNFIDLLNKIREYYLPHLVSTLYYMVNYNMLLLMKMIMHL